MANIYQVSDNFKMLLLKVEAYAEENDGEISDFLYNELTNAEQDLDEAIQDALLLAKEKQMLVNSIDSEIKRLQELKKKEKLSSDSLVRFAYENGQEPCKTAQYTLKNTKSMVVSFEDEWSMDRLPEEYINTKVTVTPDKNKIKKAIKSGQEVVGCYLEEKENWKLS